MFNWKNIFWLMCAVFFIEKAYSCTGIIKKADNGEWVYARTLEFGESLISFDLLFIPRHLTFAAQSNQKDRPNMQWKNQYAYVGFSPFGMPIVADGLNEKGLACGAFYFPGWAEYQQSSNPSSTISNLDFVSWALSNYATVDEVLNALQTTQVTGVLYQPWNIVPPLHYIVVDQTGQRAVIEYVKGQLNVYHTPIGTITNSPSYDWHLTNARNYIGLQALNRPAVKIDGKELTAFGQGSGAIGLPGDFTPPSRFIRAAFLNQVVLPAKDNIANVERAFKILNQFDIPVGAVKEVKDGKDYYEETDWTSAADLANKRYFYHTAKNRTIQFVDLKKLDLDAKEMRAIPINTPMQFVDISEKFKSS